MSDHSKERPLYPSQIPGMVNFFARYYPFLEFDDYSQDANYMEGGLTGVLTSREDTDNEIDTGEIIDEWANIVNGYCVMCRDQKARTHFYHVTDYFYGGLCHECARSTQLDD